MATTHTHAELEKVVNEALKAGDLSILQAYKDNVYVGVFVELERNWRELVGISEVGLSEEEEIFCLRLLETKVTHA